MSQVLDIAPLRSVVAVADCGGFHRAATVLHLTQSAVSQHVRRVEAVVGGPVVEKSGRGVAFTELGPPGACPRPDHPRRARRRARRPGRRRGAGAADRCDRARRRRHAARTDRRAGGAAARLAAAVPAGPQRDAGRRHRTRRRRPGRDARRVRPRPGQRVGNGCAEVDFGREASRRRRASRCPS